MYSTLLKKFNCVVQEAKVQEIEQKCVETYDIKATMVALNGSEHRANV